MATTNLQVRITADPSSFMQAMGAVNGALSKADAQARKTSSGFAAFGSSLTSVGTGLAAAITLPLVGLGVAAIKASADMEVLTKGLASVMKSSQLAGAEMDKLKVLARLPGIDLEGAVRGSIRLQALGRSADSSRRIMGELANAIAMVGGGKDDFAEVTRQLGQMQAVGKVTKENLDTITERIPQISRIMIETWGPQSVGDPAKFFEAAGISSAKFIEIITDKLSEGARAGNTFKNSFENAMQDSNLALVEFGEVLKPIAQKILDDFATPVIKRVTEVALAFKALPSAMQNFTIGAAAIAAATPIVVIALGSFLTHLATVKTAASGAWIALKSLAGMFSIAGSAAAAGGIGVAYFMRLLIDNRQSTVDTTAEAIKNLNKTAGTGTPLAFGAGRDAILGYMRVMAPVAPVVKGVGDSHGEAAGKVGELTKQMPALARVTTASEILMRLMAEAVQGHNTKLDKAADIMRAYGTVNIDTAIALIKAANAQFLLNRALDEAPDLHQKFDFKDIPKFEAPKIPIDITFMGGLGSKSTDLKVVMQGMASDIKERFKESSKVAKSALQQVSTTITDLSRGLSDLAWKGGKFGDVMKDVAKTTAQSITRLLIEGALTQLNKKLFEVGGIMGKVFSGASGPGGTIFSAAADSGASAAASAAKAGGGASSGIGSALGAANPVVAMVTAVSSVVSAISDVFSNFQFAAMNKSLDIIVKHTLQTANDLSNLRADEWLREGHLFLKLDDIWNAIRVGSGGSGGTTVNFIMAGANISSESAMDEFLERAARKLKQQGL